MGSGAAPRKRTIAGALGVLCAAGLFAGAPACDVVQGFQHAGDALFPPVKTYLDAPGFQLVKGGYRQLVLLTSTELYVLARGSRVGDEALYSTRYSVPAPCSIPAVGRYWAGGSIEAGQAWIAFFHDGSSVGTLSFSDTKCHLSALTLPEAELPYARITPRGANGEPDPKRLELLIRSAGRLLLVDPASAEEPRLVIEPADGLISNVGKASVSFVVSGSTLVAFDADWNRLDSFGEDLRSLAPVGDSLYFEDANGIQRATPTVRDGAIIIEREVLAADGCALAFPASSRRWLGFFSPCEERTLALLDDTTHELTHPDLVVDDPRALILTPKPGLTGPANPKLENVWAYFLREIDYNVGLGTLVARSPEGVELVLGTGAALERTELEEHGEYGYALVDVGDTGRLVRWTPDGSVTPLAEKVLRDSPGVSWADVMMDWNEPAGTLAQLADGEVLPLLERVPKRGFAYQNVNRQQALFSDFDGKTGTLSIGELACASGASTCERPIYVPRVVARGVHHPGHAFFDAQEDFLPGIGFLDRFDDETQTGRFQYRNLELGFTSIVSEGVSDFVYAGNGILYAVPFGEGAGIWLARAK